MERRGTLLIEDILTRTTRLVPYVAANDKTPVTDGWIQVYQSGSRAVTDIVGRLDIQVKTLTRASGPMPTNLRMGRKQLQAVRQNGTILLFVVFVRRDGEYVGPAQYRILSPYVVDTLLDGGARGSVAIPLDQLPDTSQEIEALVDFALETQKQKLYLGSGAGILEQITTIFIRSLANIDFEEPLSLSTDEGAHIIEVELSSGERFPLNGLFEITPSSYLDHPVDLTVSCGEVEYSDPTMRQTGRGSHLLMLSEGLSLTLRFDESATLDSFGFELTPAGNLATRLRDIEFALAIHTTSEVTLNGEVFEFDAAMVPSTAALERLWKNLNMVRELVETLGANAELIDVDEITSEQEDRIRYLHASLVRGIGLRADDGKPARVEEHIGRWRIPLMVVRGDEEETWNYADPFAPANRGAFKLYTADEAGSVIEVDATVYETVKRAQMSSTLNLHPSSIVAAYDALEDPGATSFYGTQTLLNLLHAADEGGIRRDELLRAAQAMNAYLLQKEPASVANALNRMQILHRVHGYLTDDERAEVRSLRRQVVQEQEPGWVVYEAGCAILLGLADDLEDCVGRMSEKERQDLKSYPIWALSTAADAMDTPGKIPPAT